MSRIHRRVVFSGRIVATSMRSINLSNIYLGREHSRSGEANEKRNFIFRVHVNNNRITYLRFARTLDTHVINQFYIYILLHVHSVDLVCIQRDYTIANGSRTQFASQCVRICAHPVSIQSGHSASIEMRNLAIQLLHDKAHQMATEANACAAKKSISNKM